MSRSRTGATQMNRTIFSLLLAFGLLSFAVPGAENARAQTSEAARENSYRPARVRPRIRVAPAYPYRFYSTTYPVPYKYEYPGPGAVRDCTSWLAQENRPSGPVIVPRMRCWWER
jgi:hypothetical protein